MFPFHLLLGHVVADHGFTNNAKIREYKGWKLIGHMIWSVFAILAFTFDVIFKSTQGTIVFFISVIVHIAGDLFRVKLHKKGKKRAIDFLETSLLIVFFFLNFSIRNIFANSYLTSEFIFYLLGMNVVSVAVTYIFRNLIPGDPKISDIEGISERLAFFVFLLADRKLFAFLSLVLGFLYRLWKFKKPDVRWWMSPVLGVVLSAIWNRLMYGRFF
ncbi:hypothetical protein [Thermotoga sp. KOL6]|uniref:hypothetical protein n=1 Tax=Thermotoga sp. KOL6 TaxID=126741 RepID=UPI000CAD0FD6|nr:hypothetical protein [Thermotoga sp. KOL6]PLV59443.1 hypothetical protein AS005_06805 [Thermotoga sp. KOL6]